MEQGEQGGAAARQIVVMGVSGVGKSTVGALLAERLGLPYADGDAFHAAASKAKMAAGHALTDVDRWPWLARIGGWLAQHADGAVVSCSALKRSYRDALTRAAPGILFFHLTGEAEQIAARMAARTEHFMPATLLRSQLATLEPLQPDERGLTLSVSEQTPEQLVEHFVTLRSSQART